MNDSGKMTPREETIINIAVKAGELLAKGKIEPSELGGFMELTQNILSMADRFEKKVRTEGIDFETGDHDYWEEVDDFAEKTLLQEYGREEEKTEFPVKLWARVGMTLEVSEHDYQEMAKDGHNVLQEVLNGQRGRAYLDGETYFPDIENGQNRDLAEVNFDLYDGPPIEPQEFKSKDFPKPDDPQTQRILKAMEAVGYRYEEALSFDGWAQFTSGEIGSRDRDVRIFPSIASAEEWLLANVNERGRQLVESILKGEVPNKGTPAKKPSGPSLEDKIQDAEKRIEQDKGYPGREVSDRGRD